MIFVFLGDGKTRKNHHLSLTRIFFFWGGGVYAGYAL